MEKAYDKWDELKEKIKTPYNLEILKKSGEIKNYNTCTFQGKLIVDVQYECEGANWYGTIELFK